MYSENGLSAADMAAVLNGNRGGYGGGMFGDGAWWIIILFLFAMNGGWGNNGNGANNGFVPWMAGQQNGVQQGFDQAAIINGITGVNNAVTGGFANMQTALCNGFAGVANGFAQAEIANNARQMADMQQNFALQTQLSQCCCDNRTGIEGVKYAIAQENCADRAAVSDGVRDILANQNANTQKIVDIMCQDKIDAKNELIANLRQQLYMKDLAASQADQTAMIQAGQRALANEVEQYVLPTARPAYVVPNPNCCQTGWNGCGCGA